MKLPALWIAAAFAAGIALVMRWPHQPSTYAAVAALAILAGGIFVWRRLLSRLRICALAAWIALGGLAFGIEQAAVPANHVTRLIAANRIDLDRAAALARAIARRPARDALGPPLRNRHRASGIAAARFSRRAAACAQISTTIQGNRLKLPKRFARATAWKLLCARSRRGIFSIPARSIFTAICAPENRFDRVVEERRIAASC